MTEEPQRERLFRTHETLKPPAQWNLSWMETNVLDAYLQHGQGKLVAKSLERSVGTIRTHTARILEKSGAVNMLVAAVAWDRYSRKAAA